VNPIKNCPIIIARYIIITGRIKENLPTVITLSIKYLKMKGFATKRR
jgi:hypothetical protein